MINLPVSNIAYWIMVYYHTNLLFIAKIRQYKPNSAHS